MIICDTHCDTLYMRALQPQKTPCVTMEAMKKGGMSLQTCTLYAGNAGMAGHPYDKAMAEYHAFEHLRDTEGWTRVDSPLEAEDGKVKILLSVEGGEIFEGKVEQGTRVLRLRRAHGRADVEQRKRDRPFREERFQRRHQAGRLGDSARDGGA